jgi:hypothetical protein
MAQRGGGQFEGLLASGRARLWEWRLAEAEAAFAAALRLCPDAADAHYLLGEALFLQRRLDEALRCHATAARLVNGAGTAPGEFPGELMSGLVPGDFGWMSHMLQGDFAAAWQCADKDREQRLRAGLSVAGWPRHMRPVWDGRPLAGTRVLVRCHHGLGDTVQFIRYVPLLARKAEAVCVEAQPPLIPLLRSLPGIAALHELPETADRPCGEFGCNAEIDVTELPHAFRTALDTIPASVPYLHPEPDRVAEAARRLWRLSAPLKVGLVWTAGEWKPERSIALGGLAGLATIPGVAFVNLQRGPEYRRRHGAAGSALLMTEIFAGDDIGDAAATIARLDLVVTVDTLVAHLAGALGVPVWLMLHFAADWRWLLERDDSPWYPTLRLYRQSRPGDWEPVVAAVVTALRDRAGR